MPAVGIRGGASGKARALCPGVLGVRSESTARDRAGAEHWRWDGFGAMRGGWVEEDVSGCRDLREGCRRERGGLGFGHGDWQGVAECQFEDLVVGEVDAAVAVEVAL